MAELKKQLEALLIASDEPITINKLNTILGDSKPSEIKQAIGELQSDYQERGFSLEEIAGGYQMLTRPEHADIISGLHKSRTEKKLSGAALETLAIIAYKQPIKRADVEAIRGVQSGEIIRALMERKMVRIVGRENVPGNPVLYGSTDEFLKSFGLASLKDLPQPEEI